jgi:hypothetical protein
LVNRLVRIRKLDKFIDNYIEFMKKEYIGVPAIEDKISHIKRVQELTEKIAPNDALAPVAAKFHDIGRFEQYKLLGKFDDGQLLHHISGEDTISRCLFKKELEKSGELDIVRDVVQFHGRVQFMPHIENLPDEVRQMVDIISRADDLDNGFEAVTYLEREARDDVKSYKKNSPDMDMKAVSKDVMDFFEKGEKFDKMVHCKTYADYILFAAVLSIQSLKGPDHDVAKIGMMMPRGNYENALEGYKDLFTRLINKEDGEKAYKILKGFYVKA